MFLRSIYVYQSIHCHRNTLNNKAENESLLFSSVLCYPQRDSWGMSLFFFRCCCGAWLDVMAICGRGCILRIVCLEDLSLLFDQLEFLGILVFCLLLFTAHQVVSCTTHRFNDPVNRCVWECVRDCVSLSEGDWCQAVLTQFCNKGITYVLFFSTFFPSL